MKKEGRTEKIPQAEYKNTDYRVQSTRIQSTRIQSTEYRVQQLPIAHNEHVHLKNEYEKHIAETRLTECPDHGAKKKKLYIKYKKIRCPTFNLVLFCTENGLLLCQSHTLHGVYIIVRYASHHYPANAHY